MRTTRLWRQWICRAVFPALFTLASGSAAAAADHISGVIVDQSGRVIPRAYVRIIGLAGDAVGGFADESGRFRLPLPRGECRVQAALAGFETTSVPCGGGEELRIVLAVAPVRESTIVTATRTPVPTSQIGATATVFAEQDLERRQTPLIADLLTATPGAMVVRSGARGALTSFFVRGGESDYNKVLLDGIPLNEPGGTFYFSNLTTENLERVEILRGAYSSLFGSDAMGSVVQLFTRRATGSRPQATAQFDGGNLDTLHATANVSGGAGRLDYSLGAARFASDNRAPNSRFENTTATLNVGVAVAPHAVLRTIWRTERGQAGTPGPTAYGRPDLDAFSDRVDLVGSISIDQQSNSFRHRGVYSHASSRQQSTNLLVDAPYRATFEGRTASRLSTDFQNDSVNDVARHHASYQADIRIASAAAWGEHLLTGLVDWNGERAEARDRLADTLTNNSRDNWGVALQEQMMWPRAFVTLGARLERNDSFGTVVVPRATAVYVVHPSTGSVGDTQVKASIGKGIKEPTMLESFSVSPFFLGNPSLRPERSRSIEAGVVQRLARDRAKVEISVFHNRFSDVISLVPTNPATFESQYANVGVTHARGVEATADISPVRAFHIRGGYTFLDTKVLASERPDDVVFGLGRPAFRRPRHSGYVGLSYSRDRITADLNGVFVGPFADSDFGLFNPPFLENPGHRTWDARATVRVVPHATALIAVDNLTNADYSEPIGYQPLLRTVRVGLRFAF
jgi:outer membrane cobalamin receptor